MFVFLSYIAYHNADWYFKNASDYRGAARRGARGSEPPPKFSRSVNLIRTRGAEFAPHTTASPSPPDSACYLHLWTSFTKSRLIEHEVRYNLLPFKSYEM